MLIIYQEIKYWVKMSIFWLQSLTFVRCTMCNFFCAIHCKETLFSYDVILKWMLLIFFITIIKKNWSVLWSQGMRDDTMYFQGTNFSQIFCIMFPYAQKTWKLLHILKTPCRDTYGSEEVNNFPPSLRTLLLQPPH